MANEKELKEKLKVAEGNVDGMRKHIEKIEKENKALKSDQEKNKGMSENLKIANEKVKTLTGQCETLAKKAGSLVGEFPKILGFKKVTPCGDVRLDKNSVVNMYRVEIHNIGPMILHVTSKDGKGESSFLTPLK